MRWLNCITDWMDIEFEQTQGDSEGQESLASCSSWGLKGSDTTEQLHPNSFCPFSTPKFSYTFMKHEAITVNILSILGAENI